MGTRRVMGVDCTCHRRCCNSKVGDDHTIGCADATPPEPAASPVWGGGGPVNACPACGKLALPNRGHCSDACFKASLAHEPAAPYEPHPDAAGILDDLRQALAPDEIEREIRAIYDGWGESDDSVNDLVKRLAYLVRADRARVAELEAVLTWYATAPRDEDGATMPLDMGERARTVLAKRS